MRSDRRSLLVAGLSLSAVGGTRTWAQTAAPRVEGGVLPPGLVQPLETLDLWPGVAPGIPSSVPTEKTVERSDDSLVNDRAVSGIAVPRMAVFRPMRPNGAAVLLMPGGGYRHVVVDKEGYEMGRWLATRGFTAFVLFYRLPGDGWEAGPNAPLCDAQRAIRLIRFHSGRYGVEPERVAAIGFSAGGHLCADLATRFDANLYESVDGADSLSAKPFCAAPIYPVVSMNDEIAHAGSRRLLLGSANPTEELERSHSPDQNVPRNAPPFFLLHAEDDEAVPVENTLVLRAALKRKSVPVETHLFEHGGHGFGLRKAVGKPVEIWPDLWLEWARSRNLA